MDRFFESRSTEIARSLHESERRYSYMLNMESPPAWDDLTDEQQAARILALQAAAARGLVILGA